MSGAKKRMLADLLWEAANERLCAGTLARRRAVDRTPSCYAVVDAIWARTRSSQVVAEEQAMGFLQSLGCDTDKYQFQDFSAGTERQGVRYIWLLLAMHVAEDEGITV